MPVEIDIKCDACHHAWQTFNLAYHIGPLKYSPPHYKTLWCPQCLIEVLLISRIDRSAWFRWLRSNKDEAVFSKFTTNLCDQISAILSKRLWYFSADIELSPLNCPRCPHVMETGDWESAFIICPECKNRTGRIAPITTIVTMCYPDGIP